MSIKIMSLVWDTEIGPATKRLVLLALADSANDEGVTWPLMNTIAHRARCGLSTARQAVADLEADGLLAREERRVTADRNQSNMYRLNVEAIEGAARSWREGAARIQGEVPPESGPPAARIWRENRKENHHKEPTTAPGGASDPATPALQAVSGPDPEQSQDEGLTLNQRATRLAQAHYERLGKMGNVPAFMKIIRKALEHGYPDQTVDRACAYIAEHRWTLTGEKLANTLRGGPRRPDGPPPAPPARHPQHAGTRPAGARPPARSTVEGV